MSHVFRSDHQKESWSEKNERTKDSFKFFIKNKNEEIYIP